MLAVDHKFQDRSVCVLGLGYVGLTLAVTMASVGFEVIGVEKRKDIVDLLKKGEPHFFEPGLKEMLQTLIKNKKIKFVNHVQESSSSTMYIITVGTPLDDKGRVRMDMVESVSGEIAGILKEGDMVIARSTVKIGTTQNVIVPVLNKANVDYDLAFCPERTLEGQALAELRQLPQIVGGINFKSTVRAGQIFQFLTPTVLRVSSVESAEMIKLVDNTSRDVSFAYANEVTRICDSLGINAIEIIKAGKLGYARTNVALPGLVGGPCLTKDSYILGESVKRTSVDAGLTLKARRLNENQPFEVVDFIHKAAKKIGGFPKKPVVSLLGIAFKGKPVTDDLRGTMARPVLDALKKKFPKATFQGYDSAVPLKEIKKFGLNPKATLAQAFKKADIVLFLNNNPEFSRMSLERYADMMSRPGLIYDFWNFFSEDSFTLPEKRHYLSLGNHFRLGQHA